MPQRLIPGNAIPEKVMDAEGRGSGTGSAVQPADPWEQFTAPRSSTAFLNAWFSVLCSGLSGVAEGVLLLERQGGGFARAAAWPGPATVQSGETGNDVLETACRDALEKASVTVRVDQSARQVIGYPVIIDGKVQALVGLVRQAGATGGVDGLLRGLHWGCGWMHSLVHQQQATLSEAARSQSAEALRVLAALEDAPGLEGALRALANEVRTIADADRVSVALVRQGRLKVMALSQAADVERKSAELRTLTQAMEEARSQLEGVLYPPANGDTVPIVAAHKAHAARSGSRAMISLPLIGPDGTIGVISAERMAVTTEEPDDGATFEVADRALLNAVATLATPTVDLKIREHRWVSGRLRDKTGRSLRRVFGPGHTGLKVLLLALVLLGGFLSVLQTDLRVTAPAALRGDIQRVAVAPFNGYVGAAMRKAGDRVEAGEVLARLDDRDLRLEVLKWQSERTRLVQEQRQALANGDRVAMATTTAQISRAEAELDLAEAQLARLDITAPFDGLIVEGDLSQRLGAPVNEGDVLFEVASGGAYRITITVSEYDIRLVEPGAEGTLALAGFSNRPFPFRVTRIASVSGVAEGRNAFTVEAELLGLVTNDDTGLRPGLEGVAKIAAGRTGWLLAVTRPLLERLRIVLWTWLP
ncbi:MAG: HlyD family efflux transporter periplasmic adaptor subunit [Pseudomonadota bacterium]